MGLTKVRQKTSFLFNFRVGIHFPIISVHKTLRFSHCGPSKIKNAYKLLNLNENECKVEDAKAAYLILAKKYHPDSNISGSSEDFVNIQTAYTLVVNDLSNRMNLTHEQKENIFEINHTAPQHRQYLEFGGIGHGTPIQRQRQYEKYRVIIANETVHEHRLNKHISETSQSDIIMRDRARDVHLSRQFKTSNAIERVVEDLIQESIANGDFSNLSGAGKPLRHLTETYNPQIDVTTHRLNKVLIQNGFAPEWITVDKEIRTNIRDMRGQFIKSAKKIILEDCNETSGSEELEISSKENWEENVETIQSNVKWKAITSKIERDIVGINVMIQRFNLLVPILSRQLIPLESWRELKYLLHVLKSDNLREEPADESISYHHPNISNVTTGQPMTDNSKFMTLLSSLFKSYM